MQRPRVNPALRCLAIASQRPQAPDAQFRAAEDDRQDGQVAGAGGAERRREVCPGDTKQRATDSAGEGGGERVDERLADLTPVGLITADVGIHDAEYGVRPSRERLLGDAHHDGSQEQ